MNGKPLGLSRYQFNTDGTVLVTTIRKLKPQYDKDGYQLIGVTRDDGSRTTLRLHRAIASLHIPNPENKPMINHKDGNKSNNNIENLEWATASENTDHAVRTGLMTYKGEGNKNSKLKDDDIKKIRERYTKGGVKQSELAEQYGVSQHLISLITRRENWIHV